MNCSNPVEHSIFEFSRHLVKYYPDASCVQSKSDLRGPLKLGVQTVSHDVLKLHVRNCQVSKIKAHVAEIDTVRVALNLAEIPLFKVGCKRLSIKSSRTQRPTCAYGQPLTCRNILPVMGNFICERMF